MSRRVCLAGKAHLPYHVTEGDIAMVRLKVTSKGQVTLKREVLDHLGVKPGDEVEVDLLPRGRLTLQGPPKRHIEDFFSSLKNVHGLHFTIEEIGEEIEKAWAGED
jgi:bifunctional DNA-binding transcriptional regulator/antitoxin component of YhaV-PrlF toxin-antitoxin module